MTPEATAPVAPADFDISVFDPKTWKEPVEVIPVKVKVSRPRWSSPEYNAKSATFQPAYPQRGKGPNGDSIMQWDFQLERLDADYLTLEGALVPVTIYAGVDLEKYTKDRRGNYTLTSVMQGRSKEALMIKAWTDAAGSLLPDPSKLEGQIWLIEFFRKKAVPGTDFTMNNVALPKELLPPTYTYTGERFVFKVKAKDVTETVTTGASAFGGSTVDEATAAEKIGQFLRDNGYVEFDSTILGAAGFPEGCRIEPFISAFVSGDAKVRETLARFGVEV